MPTLNDWQPAQIGLAMAFLQELVIALGWLTTGWLLKDVRRPALHWAGFSLLSGGSFLNFVVSTHTQLELVRLLGNTLFMSALLLQTRGLLLFTLQPLQDRLSIGAMVLMIGALWLWPSHADAPWRVATISALSCLCCLWTALVIFRHMRREIARARSKPRLGNSRARRRVERTTDQPNRAASPSATVAPIDASTRERYSSPRR